MLKRVLFPLFLLTASCAEGTQLQPWLGNFYEFEVRSSFLYQGYSRLSVGNHTKKHSSNDLFLNLSICNSKPDPEVGLELELTQALTRRQKGEIDQIKLTGRYMWMDDIAGDSISVTPGFSYVQAFTNSLNDVSSFHHGLYNTELFVSIGKEKADETVWGSHWWAVFALGVAEKGSAWLLCNLDYEMRFLKRHAFGAFLHTLIGFGGQGLHPHHFRGYGPVAHRSIELGLRYIYFIEYYGEASLEYSYRAYSRNFPLAAHRVMAQILFTFGL